METATRITSDYSSLKVLEANVASGEPVLDKEGNVIPHKPIEKKYEAKPKDKYGQVSPIPRLAAVAALDKPVPTAGGWGIENMKEDPQKDLVIPPECYLYDEDRPWVLGKLNPEALGVPEPADPVPLSQKTLDYFEALDAAYMAELEKERKAAANQNEMLEQAEQSGNKKVTLVTPEAADKVDAAINTKKMKSRNASTSPSKKAGKPVITGRSSTSSPRVETTAAVIQNRKSSKSPGRGVSPQAKIVPSSGPKKIVNAK